MLGSHPGAVPEDSICMASFMRCTAHMVERHCQWTTARVLMVLSLLLEADIKAHVEGLIDAPFGLRTDTCAVAQPCMNNSHTKW